MKHTRQELRALVEVINQARTTAGLSADYYLNCSGEPVRPRLEKRDGPGSVYISPRLSFSEMYNWLTAYLAGMHAGSNERVGY